MNNHDTNTTVVAVGGAVAMLIVAALHYFSATQGFMESIGSPGDVAVTTIITAVLGYFLPADFMQLGKPQ